MKRNNKGQFAKGMLPHNKKSKVTIICSQCGENFEVSQRRRNKAKYCSKECYWKSKKGYIPSEQARKNMSKAQQKRNGNPWEPWSEIKCKFCGKEFKAKTYLRREYCSKQCSFKDREGSHLSPELKKKISESNKGLKRSKEKRENISKALIKRFKDPKELKKLRLAHLGHIPWNKGKTGIYSEETLRRMKENQYIRYGKDSHLYLDGRTPLTRLIRNHSYNLWQKPIFERDNYICQDCGKHGGILHSHHLQPFAKILNDFLTFYDNFSPIEDKETLVRLSYKWKDFWNTDNGITLCEDCHKLRHKQEVSICL